MTRLLLTAALAVALGGAARAQTAPAGDSPTASASGDTLTVVTLNIWFNSGDWPARLEGIVAGLEGLDADVVLLQEVLQNATLPNQAETLAARLGMPYVQFFSVDTLGSVKRFGNAILSREPFEATHDVKLPPLDAYRVATHGRIRWAGLPVDLYSTHLHNPDTADGAGTRAMEIAHLLHFVQATRADGPMVLGGDFNAEPDYPEMRMLDGLRDLSGHAVTFGPTVTQGPGRHIDYLFDGMDARLVPIEMGRALDRPDAAGVHPSDHYAIYARFVSP